MEPPRHGRARAEIYNWSVFGVESATEVVAAPVVVDDDGRLIVEGLPPGTVARVVIEQAAAPGRWIWTRGRRGAAVAALAAVAAVALIATIGRRWSWSGFSGHDTLWSWMSLLAQPVALAILPLELLTRGWSRRPWKIAGAVVAAVLAVVALGGYGFGWSWTGLSGITLWDWLHVLLFPVVLVFLPSWAAQGAVLARTGRALIGGGAICSVVIVVVGYRLDWAWTGFVGNTFRDWLVLLIAPFLLPAACKMFHIRQTARPPIAQIAASVRVDITRDG